MTTTLTRIPSDQITEWTSLSEATRKIVSDRLLAMREILATRGNSKERKAAIQKQAGICGMSRQSMYRFLKNFIDADYSWKTLVDKRAEPKMQRGGKKQSVCRNKEFCKFWLTLQLKYHRGQDAAYRELIRHLQAWRRGGEPIPGYATPPKNAAYCDHPIGWGLRNLREIKPENIETAAAKKGRGAAKSFAPSVITSRVKMYPGQELQFDDMWHDHFVMVNGKKGAFRPLEFGGIDLCSGFILNPGIRARVKNNDTDSMTGLTEKDFRCYIAMILTTVGYRPEGTVLTVEHGTATLRDEVIHHLHMISGGAITVKKGSIRGKAAYPGANIERAKGNFRMKALKEGMGNLIHNEFSALPGQVGANWKDAPAELHGRVKENDMLQAYCMVYPQLTDALKFGLLTDREFTQYATDLYDRINSRTNHGMQGFYESGWTVNEYCLDGQAWLPSAPLLALPDDRKEAIATILNNNPMMRRTRLMSPKEVFMHQKEHFVTIPSSALPGIIGKDFAEKLTVVNKCFTVSDKDVTEEKRMFLAEIDGNFGKELLPNESEWLTFINPFKPTELIICDQHNRYVGTCCEWEIIDRMDHEAIVRQAGKAQSIYNRSIINVAHTLGAENIARREHNNELIAAAMREGAKLSEEVAVPHTSRKEKPASNQDDIMKLLAKQQEEAEINGEL